MLDIEALISSSLPLWDTVAMWSGIAAGVAAIGAIVVDISGLIESESARAKIKYCCIFLLLAGVGGQLVATTRLTAITGEIVAFLNDRAETANKAAQTLAVEVQILKGQNLDLEKRLNEKNDEIAELKLNQQLSSERQTTSETRQQKTEKKIELTEARISPRTLDQYDLWLHIRKLRRAIPSVTIVRVAEPEPNQYAEKIGGGMKRAQIDVVPEALKEPSLITGVLICSTAGAKRLSQSIALGGVPNRVLSTKDKEWADVCTSHTNGVFGPSFVTRRGIVIFVGHNPQVVK